MPVVDEKGAEAIRKRLRELRDSEFGGKQAPLARALKITSAYLSELLSGKRNPGMKVLKALAKRFNLSVDDIVGDTQAGLEPRWCNLPGWSDAFAEARRMFPRVSETAWKWVGNLAGARPPAMTGVVLGSIASVWDQHSQDDTSQKPRVKGATPPRKAAVG